jgi:hypothetical protein
MYRDQRNYENLNRAKFIGAGAFDIPRILAEVPATPQSWIGFNYAKSCKDPANKAVHFFVDDYQFNRLWTNPDAYLDMLRRFKAVCTPDFSTYTDFPKAVQIWNHYRKHWLGAYWQGNGITVIPQAAIGIHELNGSESRSNAYASASLSGKLQLNPKMMGDQAKLDQSYENDVRVKWHPDGTSSVHIASHEIGHLLESALVFKNITQTGYYGTMDRINAWNKHRFATKVVGEAARAAKKTAVGKGLTNDQLVAQISRYATKNRSEAMAEAVADYRANGSRAKPLSQAIWKILKRELG